MGDSTTGDSGRSHARMDVLATAILFRRGEPIGRFIVQDLSAGGALLTGSQSVEPGKRVRVVLQFPDHEIVAVDAHVVRRGRAGDDLVSLAVQFHHRTDATEDLIQREALVALLRAQHPAVLLVCDRPEARRRIADQLEGLGRSVRVAATPLDVLRWLEDPNEQIDTVIVTQSLRRPGALALLGFIAEEYPSLRRVLLADGPAELASSTDDRRFAEEGGRLAHLIDA